MFIGVINKITPTTSVYDILKDYREIRKVFGMERTTCEEKIEKTWGTIKTEDECKKKDRVCAKGLAAIALMNGPNDIDDIVSAWRQIKSGFKEKCPDSYDPKKAQHPFSFFRGTIFHEYLNPNSEKCINKKLAKWIIKNDVSLIDTKFGEWILTKLGVIELEKFATNINDIAHTELKPRKVEAKIYKAPSKFGELTARALARTPKYAVGTLGSITAIHAAYEINEGEDIKKEICKTALEFTTTLVGIAYLGAIGYKHFSACGSLLGMGLGTFLGEKLPELLFEHSSKSI